MKVIILCSALFAALLLSASGDVIYDSTSGRRDQMSNPPAVATPSAPTVTESEKEKLLAVGLIALCVGLGTGVLAASHWPLMTRENSKAWIYCVSALIALSVYAFSGRYVLASHEGNVVRVLDRWTGRVFTL